MDIESPEFEVYNNLKSSEDVDSLVMSGKVQGLCVGDVRQNGFLTCSRFKKVNAALQPIMWGQINSDIGMIELGEFYTGVYLYLKLIGRHRNVVDGIDRLSVRGLEINLSEDR